MQTLASLRLTLCAMATNWYCVGGLMLNVHKINTTFDSGSFTGINPQPSEWCDLIRALCFLWLYRWEQRRINVAPSSQVVWTNYDLDLLCIYASPGLNVFKLRSFGTTDQHISYILLKDKGTNVVCLWTAWMEIPKFLRSNGSYLLLLT